MFDRPWKKEMKIIGRNKKEEQKNIVGRNIFYSLSYEKKCFHEDFVSIVLAIFKFSTTLISYRKKQGNQ